MPVNQNEDVNGTATSSDRDALSESDEKLDLRGSLQYDLEHGYNLQWGSMDEFEQWFSQEKKTKSIDFSVKARQKPTNPALFWTTKAIYVCGRGFSGGKNKYMPKKEDPERKLPSKRIGCPCRLIVKTYKGTGAVLGLYTQEHSHEIGNTNVRFTRLPAETRQKIEELLRMGVEPNKVVSNTKFWTVLTHLINLCLA
jgi:hypothetical protein